MPSVRGAIVADRVEMWSFEISYGDVVLRGDDAGVVASACSYAGRFWLVVQACELVRSMSDHSSVCRTNVGTQVWSPNDIRLALAWRRREDGTVLVVRQ